MRFYQELQRFDEDCSRLNTAFDSRDASRASKRSPRNGKWWGLLNDYQRQAYVTSVFDGMSVGLNLSYDSVSARVQQQETQNPQKILKGLTSDEVIRRLCEFYQDRHNRSIIASDAVMLVAIKSHLGESCEARALYPAAVEDARRRARGW